MPKLQENQAKTCSTCQCWDSPDQIDAGKCRANPPAMSGWPSTRLDDWCIQGWKKSTRPQPVKRVKKLDVSRVGICYRYILENPANALEWLNQAFANPSNIPKAMLPLLRQPDQAIATQKLPVADDTIDDCDHLFNWATSIPGGEVDPEDEDLYLSILMYVDDDDDKELHANHLKSLGAENAWIVQCKELASAHLPAENKPTKRGSK